MPKYTNTKQARAQASGEMRCACCGLTKPLAAFRTRPDGRLFSYCRPCDSAKQRKLYKPPVGLREIGSHL
jgi:hypothetical protein